MRPYRCRHTAHPVLVSPEGRRPAAHLDLQRDQRSAVLDHGGLHDHGFRVRDPDSLRHSRPAQLVSHGFPIRARRPRGRCGRCDLGDPGVPAAGDIRHGLLAMDVPDVYRGRNGSAAHALQFILGRRIPRNGPRVGLDREDVGWQRAAWVLEGRRVRLDLQSRHARGALRHGPVPLCTQGFLRPLLFVRHVPRTLLGMDLRGPDGCRRGNPDESTLSRVGCW